MNAASDPLNVAAYVDLLAQVQPDALAVAAPNRGGYAEWTYAELRRMTDRCAVGLQQFGAARGMRTALLVKPGLPFFGLVFALFKLGAVPVLIDPGIGAGNFGRCLNEAEPEAFIGIPAAHIARVLLGWGRKSIRHLVTVGRRLGWGGASLDSLTERVPAEAAMPAANVQPEETAAILFTSGSTGPPKGAVYTHGMFASQVRLLKETYGLSPGEIDLCTFPLFALFAPALGWSAIVPDMDFTRPGSVEPRKILEPIRRFGVTNLFGSPALLERVALSPAAEGRKLPSLRRVITAGAPVRPDILEAFSKLLAEDVPIHTPYGATEALPVATIASQEILGETQRGTALGAGNCVGRPVAGMTVRIIRICDEPIPAWSETLLAPPGEIGEIVVQGPVASPAYWKRPEQTALAKIMDGDRFWHRMGDVGRFDEQGRLWMCGRKSHRVVLQDRTLFTLPCEGVFNVHPEVRRTALVGVELGQGTVPVLCVELRPGTPASRHAGIERELRELGARHEHTQPIQSMLFHANFPVDIRHNAKIFREKLAVWAARRLKR